MHDFCNDRNYRQYRVGNHVVFVRLDFLCGKVANRSAAT